MQITYKYYAIFTYLNVWEFGCLEGGPNSPHHGHRDECNEKSWVKDERY